MPGVFAEVTDTVPSIEDISNVKTAALERVLGPALEKVNHTAQEVRDGKAEVIDFLIEKERLEVLRSAFDATGAYREEIFHIKLRESLEKRGYEFDELGLLKAKEEDTKTIWFGATLPELPLVNQKGGHEDAGNLTLGTMTLAFENGLVANGGWENTDGVFHTRGADFVFNAHVENNALDHIYEGISQVKLPEIYGTSARPEITLSHVSLAEVIELFNEAQVMRGIKDPTDMVLDSKAVQKELSGILARVLDYNREFDKVKHLALQVSTGSENSETYFNNFVKKYFKGTEYSDYLDFKNLVDKEPSKADFVITSVAQRAAQFSITKGSLEDARSAEVLEQLLFDKMPHLHLDTLPGSAQETEISIAQPSQEDLKRELKRSLEVVGGLSSLQDTLVEHRSQVSTTEPTFHAAQYLRVKKIVESAREEFDALTLSEIDQSQIAIIRALLDISNLDRDIELLGVKKNFYLEVQEMLNQPGLTEQNLQTLRKFILFSEQRLKVFEARHDKGTGLPNRYEYYRDSNYFVEFSLKRDVEVAGVYFVDLAFLNYFNQRANRATGNKAIETSVKQLEDAFKEQYGPLWKSLIRVYRYGGDELAILFYGTDLTPKIKEILDNLNETGKPIEAVGKPDPDYIPERIQYNYGFCDMRLAREGLKSLIESGNVYNSHELARLNDPAEKAFYAENVAKVMTNMADQLVDKHKVSERFKMLMQRYIGLKAQGDSADWKHFNDLLDFSGKALLGVNIDVFEKIYTKGEQEENPNYLALFKEEMKNKGIEPELDVISTLIDRRAKAIQFARSATT